MKITRDGVRRFLVLLLFADALAVFVMQVHQINAWFYICLYWAILTVKNSIDLGDLWQ